MDSPLRMAGCLGPCRGVIWEGLGAISPKEKEKRKKEKKEKKEEKQKKKKEGNYE